jgi:catechol 2,3-dioxygenase
MEQQTTQLTRTSINPDTQISSATLRVANLDRALKFYQGVLGFRLIERAPGKVSLGAEDGPPILELHEVPGASPAPRSTGLFHLAIVLPSRAALGQALMRMIAANSPIGQADHAVSEGFHIADPDGNGLEIYRDRPRDSWQWQDGMVKMTVDPVDVGAVLAEGQQAAPSDLLPAGTRIGHVHLKVADLATAERFYHTILGFDITAKMPGAVFLSAGGYHHNIGLNTWQSRGAAPAPETAAGLESFVIALPNHEALAEVRARLIAAGVQLHEQGDDILVADPSQNQIRLTVAPSL